MKKALQFSAILFGMAFLASCASSNKVNYDEAYKFKVIKHTQQAQVQEAEAPAEESLVASQKEEELTPLETKVKEAQQKVFDKLEVNSQEELVSFSRADWKKRVAELDKKERKELRKELKSDMREVRQLVKEQKKTGEITNAETKEAVSGYTRTGIIIGGVGLVLLIIGAVTTNVLTVIGAVALAVGLVFILIDVL